MGIDSAITGLQGIADSIQQSNQNLKNKVEQATGEPFPSPYVSSGIVVNRKAIIWQIKDLPDKFTLPDLVMRINPDNLNSSYSQLINRKRTLGGFIEEHWGEQLDTLSASGRTGQFIGDKGLTNVKSRTTKSYREFEKFVSMYRNNGTLYDEGTGAILAQVFVVMNYDSAIYNGYFENFSISEVADKPFELKYTFSFKVTHEVFPGRIMSFQSVTTVTRPNAPKNDRVTLDITTVPSAEG